MPKRLAKTAIILALLILAALAGWTHQERIYPARATPTLATGPRPTVTPKPTVTPTMTPTRMPSPTATRCEGIFVPDVRIGYPEVGK